MKKSELLDKGYIHVSAIIEILGKPKEHVEQALNDYLKQIGEDKDYVELKHEINEAIEVEDQKGFYTTYAELDFWAKNTSSLVKFCFDYMPSSVEIMEPEEILYTNNVLTGMLSDLQGRLHHVDMLTKKLYNQTQSLNSGMNNLIRNIVMILLSRDRFNIDTLSKLSGVKIDNLKQFLDKMVEEKTIKEEQGTYSLVKDGRADKQD